MKSKFGLITLIDDFDSSNYIKRIVEHKFARERGLQTYKSSLATD